MTARRGDSREHPRSNIERPGVESLRAAVLGSVKKQRRDLQWRKNRMWYWFMVRGAMSWYQISANDRMIPPEAETWMAERIRPKKTITLQASHASLASQADAIVGLIEEASTAVM